MATVAATCQRLAPQVLEILRLDGDGRQRRELAESLNCHESAISATVTWLRARGCDIMSRGWRGYVIVNANWAIPFKCLCPFDQVRRIDDALDPVFDFDEVRDTEDKVKHVVRMLSVGGLI